jgi:hypothetical protein
VTLKSSKSNINPQMAQDIPFPIRPISDAKTNISNPFQPSLNIAKQFGSFSMAPLPV